MPAFPPIVPGLTETARTASSGDLMGQLAGQSSGSPPTSGMTLLREAIAGLREAAGVDPRLQQRIAKAIAVIEGTDETSVRQRESGGEQNRTGSLLGNAKTPI
jgi:hypothetical protein